ncbi:MAG: glycosyltransferase [Candidatus Hydrogenedentota bacterium]
MTTNVTHDSPLTVLLLDAHSRGGGQVRYVTVLAKHLKALGHRPIIGCREHSVLVDRAAEVECEVVNRFQFRGGARAAAWWKDIAAMRRLMLDDQPDVIHVNGSPDHWVSAIANRTLGQPVAIARTRHNTYHVHDGLSNRILNRRWTDYQIVLGEIMRARLAARKAFDPARMGVVRNGVDAELFRPDAEARRSARVEFGYDDDHVVVGIAARLVKAKGHEFLLRALGHLREDVPQLRLLALGEGGLREDLERLAAECGVADRVLFTGFRDDMPRCIQAMDIATLPSIECDLSSFVVKEKMAAGKPLVVSDHGGLPEDVDDGVEGFVVPAGSVEPLADAFRALANDPAKREAMGQAGRERALQRYTMERYVRETVEAYREAMRIRQQGRESHHPAKETAS